MSLRVGGLQESESLRLIGKEGVTDIALTSVCGLAGGSNIEAMLSKVTPATLLHYTTFPKNKEDVFHTFCKAGNSE